jgi:hypothetical protein
LFNPQQTIFAEMELNGVGVDRVLFDEQAARMEVRPQLHSQG